MITRSVVGLSARWSSPSRRCSVELLLERELACFGDVIAGLLRLRIPEQLVMLLLPYSSSVAVLSQDVKLLVLQHYKGPRHCW